MATIKKQTFKSKAAALAKPKKTSREGRDQLSELRAAEGKAGQEEVSRLKGRRACVMKLGKIEDRIGVLRSEIDAYIDEQVVKVKGESPAVPEGVIRKILLERSPDCQCRTYLNLLQNGL